MRVYTPNSLVACLSCTALLILSGCNLSAPPQAQPTAAADLMLDEAGQAATPLSPLALNQTRTAIAGLPTAVPPTAIVPMTVFPSSASPDAAVMADAAVTTVTAGTAQAEAVSPTAPSATVLPTLPPPRSAETLQSMVTDTSAPDTATPDPATATPSATVLPTSAVPTASGLPNAEVNDMGEGLRVRQEPGLSADVVATLSISDPLELIGRTSDGGWYEAVIENGETGWVWGNYLNLSVDASTIPITGETLLDPTVPAAGGMSVVSNVSSVARQIFERGQQQGNRRDVFSKVGDSLTVATFVMYPIGWGNYNLGGFRHLQPVVSQFSGTNAREGNSFANVSLAADNGWTTRDILDPGHARGGVCQGGETPLECEYRVVRPSVALILIGTNDVSAVPVDEYYANLQRIVQISMDMGVIPIVTTIPNRFGFDVTPYNAAVMQIAVSNGVPLCDYWSAMQVLPNTGLSPDGVHPSYPSETEFSLTANFNPDYLQYGYTVRNLTALEVLNSVWQQVLSY